MNRIRETAQKLSALSVQRPPLERCPDCGGPITPCPSEKAKRIRAIGDIPSNIVPEVAAHEIPRSYCPHCKKRVEPKVEDALPNATLGNRTLSLSAYWQPRCDWSIDEMRTGAL